MYLFTITEEHVGKAIIRHAGTVHLVSNFLGQVLPHDVGKRVYEVGGILQVENDEQLQARIQRAP